MEFLTDDEDVKALARWIRENMKPGDFFRLDNDCFSVARGSFYEVLEADGEEAAEKLWLDSPDCDPEALAAALALLLGFKAEVT
jgi:hypothetical protein